MSWTDESARRMADSMLLLQEAVRGLKDSNERLATLFMENILGQRVLTSEVKAVRDELKEVRDGVRDVSATAEDVKDDVDRIREDTSSFKHHKRTPAGGNAALNSAWRDFTLAPRAFQVLVGLLVLVVAVCTTLVVLAVKGIL